MVCASATEIAPSEKAISPASARSPISAISRPMRPLVSAAEGKMRTLPFAAVEPVEHFHQRRDRPDVALGDELASSALSLAKANPRLRPLHLVVRETEFCGLRLAGYFRRRMRENSRNSVRRPRCASLTRRK